MGRECGQRHLLEKIYGATHFCTQAATAGQRRDESERRAKSTSLEVEVIVSPNFNSYSSTRKMALHNILMPCIAINMVKEVYLSLTVSL